MPPLLTVGYVRSCLEYDPETGIFLWLPRSPETPRGWNYRHAGRIAGTINTQGYRQISLGWPGTRYFYYGHRLAWLLMTGSWPAAEIDHADLDRSNDRFINLREVTHSQNAWNRAPYAKNPTGFKGVSIYKSRHRGRGPRYIAQIQANGKQHFLGRFRTAEEAAAAYAKAAAEFHGEYARVHDRPFGPG